jgi:predicted amidophosphoribosyltransferase
MTKLLERAFAEAAKLPAEEQDALATAVLSEIESERRWDRVFAESEDLLSELAEEALAEHAAGRTKRFDPDKL